MNWAVPRWVIVALTAIAACTLSLGLMSDANGWASDHSFTTNLLSSLTGFAISGVFAGIVVNRLSRRRYRDVELDRRTSTANEVDVLIRDIAIAFDCTTRHPDTRVALQSLLDEVVGVDGREASQQVHEALAQPDRDLRSSEVYPSGSQIADRFSFLDDGRLMYLGDRLDRKAEGLRRQLCALRERAPEEAAEVAVAIRAAHELLQTAVELRAWVHSAPDSWMRGAVLERAYRSDFEV